MEQTHTGSARTLLLTTTEMEQIMGGGGGIKELLLDAVMFLGSPALGLFYLGAKNGYRVLTQTSNTTTIIGK